MRILIDIEVELLDYDGKVLKQEIEKILVNSPSSTLIKFKTRSKYGYPDVKDINYMNEAYTMGE